jgi:CheY-like chemotaxis protein
MVYGFAKQSGGQVKIYSEVGQGTTVRLDLPCTLRKVNRPEVQREETEPAQGREKVLIVEDDELVRTHVTTQFISLGYRVISVSNGPEALASVRQHDDFDLVFTDVVMPGGLNGRQLAEEISRFRPTLPVLFTSGYADNAIVHHGRLDPGAHLLNKPYRRKDLADKVRLVLNGQRNPN